MGEATRIGGVWGVVASVALQVGVAGTEAGGVVTGESADHRVVPAVAVVVQIGVRIPFTARVGVDRQRGNGGGGQNLAEGAVGHVLLGIGTL